MNPRTSARPWSSQPVPDDRAVCSSPVYRTGTSTRTTPNSQLVPSRSALSLVLAALAEPDSAFRSLTVVTLMSGCRA
jgi:hypothetical protein